MQFVNELGVNFREGQQKVFSLVLYCRSFRWIEVFPTQIAKPLAKIQKLQSYAFQIGLFKQGGSNWRNIKSHFFDQHFVPLVRWQIVFKEVRDPQKVVFQDSIE